MAQWYLRKTGFNFQMLMTFGQGQEMTLTFITHLPSLTQLVVYMYQFACHRLLYFFEKSTGFTFSYRKVYVTKFDLAVS